MPGKFLKQKSQDQTESSVLTRIDYIHATKRKHAYVCIGTKKLGKLVRAIYTWKDNRLRRSLAVRSSAVSSELRPKRSALDMAVEPWMKIENMLSMTKYITN